MTEIEKLQGEIDDTLREMAALNRMTLPQRTTEEISSHSPTLAMVPARANEVAR